MAAVASAVAGGYIGYKLEDYIESWFDKKDISESWKTHLALRQANEEHAEDLKNRQDAWIKGDLNTDLIKDSFYRGRGFKEAFQSFEGFKTHIDTIRARMAKARGVALENLQELNDAQLMSYYTSMGGNINGGSTIDNSRTQNIQNISINGAQDPQAVGQEVANAGRAMMGAVMNGSNAH